MMAPRSPLPGIVISSVAAVVLLALCAAITAAAFGAGYGLYIVARCAIWMFWGVGQ